jgi:glutathione synthase/RimK-type ligase-like ATP-grasp enzyme
MSMKRVLLVTERYDPTADNLILILQGRGASFLRLNLDCYPEESRLTYNVTAENFDGSIESDGRSVPFGEIGSVWYRASHARGFSTGLAAEEREFATREAESVLDALPAVTAWRWINDPRRHREAGWKPAQLSVARQLGFAIPKTVISNDPAKVRNFCQRCGGEVIYKPLAQSMVLAPGKAIFTGVVTGKEMASLDLIKRTPGIFQELVPKAYEVRVTFIDGKNFAVKLMSQEKEHTSLDWRVAPYDLKHEPITLPSDIHDKITAFMTEFKIVYGCLDFIVTPGGHYVFLECNPRGQYLWIEYLTGLPISEAIADALTA